MSDRWNEVRPTKEWIGKRPDSDPPQSVRLRVFRDKGGICHRSGIKIRPGMAWELDHITPIIENGENRETNLAPILKDKHKIKTAEEVARRAKGDAQGMAAFGIAKPKSRLTHPDLKRGFDGVVRPR